MKILRPSLLILTLFVIGGAVFKSMTPTKCSEIFSGDTIFVLTGDSRRIPFAMRQLHKRPDTKLYIIGAGAVGTFDNIGHVKTESKSKSTYQNALAIRDIVLKNNLQRIVLVTTEDHMNRALYLVRHEIPAVEIAPCSTRLSGMSPVKRLERWTTEYIKYIFTLLGIKES